MKSKQRGCWSNSGVGKGKGVTAAYSDATVISVATFINVCNKQLPQQPNEYISTKQNQRAVSTETACGNGHSCMANNTSATNNILRLVSKQ